MFYGLYSYLLEYWKYRNFIFLLIYVIIYLLSIIFNFIEILDLDISCFDFIGEPSNNSSFNENSPQGGNNNSSGGGPGHEQSVHGPQSDRSQDQDDLESSRSRRRAKLFEKPSDDIEINTVEGAITHLEKLKEREMNLRAVVAKSLNISRDIRLRDLDISFKKPLTTPIAKYLDNCRKMEDPRRRLFHKASPGNTPIDHVLAYLRNKLNYYILTHSINKL